MNVAVMAILFTDVFGMWQRCCQMTEDGFEFHSDGISGEIDYRQDVVEHRGHGMMTLRYCDYYKMWHVTFRYANEFGPTGRSWTEHPCDHHGYRDCQAIYTFTCFIKNGYEREALEDICKDITCGTVTDKALQCNKEWSVEAAIEKLNVPRSCLADLPSNQYHQMICIVAKDLELSYDEVAQILDKFRCPKCGEGFERSVNYCSQCGANVKKEV